MILIEEDMIRSERLRKEYEKEVWFELTLDKISPFMMTSNAI